MVNKIMPWFILIFFIEPSRSLHYKFQHSPLIVMKIEMLRAPSYVETTPGACSPAVAGECTRYTDCVHRMRTNRRCRPPVSRWT